MLLSRLAIKNPEFTIMIFVLFLLLGVFAYQTIPRYENPQLDIPGVNLIITYPGASPEDIEDLVIDPIEDEVRQIEKIRVLDTDIRDGFATMRIEFELTEDKVEKNTEVTQALNTLAPDFPDGVNIQTREFSLSNVQILQVALQSQAAGYDRLKKAAEEIEEELELIGGVNTVDIEACPEKRLVIDLDFNQLSRYQISPNQVLQTIQGNNQNIPAGNLKIGQKSFNLQTSGAYEDKESIENTIIKSVFQQPIRVKDLANVYYTYENYSYIARADGTKSIFLSVYPQERVNSLNTVKKVKKFLNQYQNQQRLPSDIQMRLVFDQSESINNRINLLFGNLWQGILVVGFFILLFFNLRASMLVMIAIPLSFLIGLIMTDYAGVGLQFMSIAGLIIALGLLVDNAIVVVENVYHFIKEGYERKAAALKAIDQVGWALVSSTATTVIAFLPVLQIKNLAGEFVKSMPLTLVFTLLASLFVALTFTPFLSSRFLKSTEKQNESFIQKKIQYFIENQYRRMLAFSLKNKVLVLFLGVSSLAGAAFLFPIIGVSFFPRDDAPLFAINVKAPQGTVLEKTDSTVYYIEQVLNQRKEIRNYISNVGYGNPRVLNVIRRTRRQVSEAQVIVFLKDISFTERDLLIRELREAFVQYKEAEIEVKEALLGPPLEAQIAIKLFGDDLNILKKIAGDIEQIIRKTPNTINVYNPLANRKTDLKLNIKTLSAANMGVSLAEIDQNVRIAVSGSPVGEFRNKAGDTYDIYVQMQREGDYLSPQDLSKIYINSFTGRQVPLGQIASLEFTNGPELIKHEKGRRTFAIQSDVSPGANVDDITLEILEKVAQYKFPTGYTYSAGGEREKRQESFGDLFQSLLVALLGIFTVLVLQFRSFVQPLIIFVAIPLSFIGATLSLFLTGYSFSFTAFLGMISLVGIVVNDSIILIDLINQLITEGRTKKEAIKTGAELRFVPILLTSLTTIGGLLPLTLRGGLFWAPMGWCIIGGLSTSTLLILIIVPVLYDIFTKESDKVKKISI